jgi:hypothetical protein
MFSFQQAIFLLLFLTPIADASTFRPNCTLSNDTVTWTFSPGVRGSSNILWSCLSAIFICTWSVQHLNVPEQRDGKDPGWRGDWKWRWKSFKTKGKWMLLTLILPEVLLGKALAERISAMRSVRKMNDLLKQRQELAEGYYWTLTHAFYADMGGFVVRPQRQNRSGNPSATISRSSQTQQFELLTQVRVIGDGDGSSHSRRSTEDRDSIDLVPRTEEGPYDTTECVIAKPLGEANDNLDMTAGRPFHLRACGVFELLSRAREGDRHGYLHGVRTLPKIYKHEISDKSKGDFFAKGLALFQTHWVLAQVIVRAVKHHPITQLEIFTLAFCACTILTYILWWDKPQDVKTSMTIGYYDDSSMAQFWSFPAFRHPDTFFASKTASLLAQRKKQGEPISNDADPTTWFSSGGQRQLDWTDYSFFSENFGALDVGLMLGSLILGAIHLVAWNFEYPTLGDRNAWRALSLISTCLIPAGYPITWAFDVFSEFIAILVMIFYAASRIGLLAETIRTFFALPPEAFKSTWTTYIPHIA